MKYFAITCALCAVAASAPAAARATCSDNPDRLESFMLTISEAGLYCEVDAAAQAQFDQSLEIAYQEEQAARRALEARLAKQLTAGSATSSRGSGRSSSSGEVDRAFNRGEKVAADASAVSEVTSSVAIGW
jgi:hypothetical protein